jgi:hypothetical protein
LPLPKENETTTAVGMCSQIGLEPYTLKLRATISPRVYSGRETQVEVSRLAREGTPGGNMADSCTDFNAICDGITQLGGGPISQSPWRLSVLMWREIL